MSHQKNQSLKKDSYQYYDLIMAAFVATLLCSNLIGVTKIGEFWGYPFNAGILFFPLSYIFGDVLTEVYGYARARKVVWAGFAAMLFASIMSLIVIAIPPSKDWTHQQALETIFGSTPRIVLASLLAFFAGELTNSFVLAKMKIQTQGKFLWARTIGSTIVGEAVDSFIFYPIAFLGSLPTNVVLKILLSNYLLKVFWEIVMTPLTYKAVAFLKKVENADFYDDKTDFSPFRLKT
jgi:uncharacterized integral membrane protein (TIGR00697 family)